MKRRKPHHLKKSFDDVRAEKPPSIIVLTLGSRVQATDRPPFEVRVVELGDNQRFCPFRALLDDLKRTMAVQQHHRHYRDVEGTNRVWKLIDIGVDDLCLGFKG